jgi:DNA-directed RNA polymerase specialized sigma24 family protein
MTAVLESTPLLEEARNLTEEIRRRQHEIEDLSKARRTVIMSLREQSVTYRVIAESMRTTEQNVYKIVRDYLATQNLDQEDG